jgi:hypothetical protein
MIIPEIIKRPSERYTVGMKYLAPDLEEGATILSSTVVITPTETSGLAVWGSVSIDGNVVEQGIQAGLDGHNYYVTFTTRTSEDNIFEDSVYVKVRSK